MSQGWRGGGGGGGGLAKEEGGHARLSLGGGNAIKGVPPLNETLPLCLFKQPWYDVFTSQQMSFLISKAPLKGASASRAVV